MILKIVWIYSLFFICIFYNPEITEVEYPVLNLITNTSDECSARGQEQDSKTIDNNNSSNVKKEINKDLTPAMYFEDNDSNKNKHPHSMPDSENIRKTSCEKNIDSFNDTGYIFPKINKKTEIKKDDSLFEKVLSSNINSDSIKEFEHYFDNNDVVNNLEHKSDTTNLSSSSIKSPKLYSLRKPRTRIQFDENKKNHVESDFEICTWDNPLPNKEMQNISNNENKINSISEKKKEYYELELQKEFSHMVQTSSDQSYSKTDENTKNTEIQINTEVDSLDLQINKPQVHKNSNIMITGNEKKIDPVINYDIISNEEFHKGSCKSKKFLFKEKDLDNSKKRFSYANNSGYRDINNENFCMITQSQNFKKEQVIKTQHDLALEEKGSISSFNFIPTQTEMDPELKKSSIFLESFAEEKIKDDKYVSFASPMFESNTNKTNESKQKENISEHHDKIKNSKRIIIEYHYPISFLDNPSKECLGICCNYKGKYKRFIHRIAIELSDLYRPENLVKLSVNYSKEEFKHAIYKYISIEGIDSKVAAYIVSLFFERLSGLDEINMIVCVIFLAFNTKYFKELGSFSSSCTVEKNYFIDDVEDCSLIDAKKSLKKSFAYWKSQNYNFFNLFEIIRIVFDEIFRKKIVLSSIESRKSYIVLLHFKRELFFGLRFFLGDIDSNNFKNLRISC